MEQRYVKQLKNKFNIDGFRPFQEEVIESILSKSDTFIIADTGAGKSLCYQFSALQFRAMTIVISPLTSLILDQVKYLQSLKIACDYLRYQDSEFEKKLNSMIAGEYDIVYLSPEILVYPKYREAFKKMKISMIVVDEAHCVSLWGLSFRESYLRITDFINSLPKRPVVSAFTATAPKYLQRDIIRLLGLKSPKLCEFAMDRDHIRLHIKKVKLERSKYAALYHILETHRDQSGIIYCNTINQVDKLFSVLNKRGKSCVKFCGKMSTSKKEEAYSQFMKNKKRIMIATNAFGMGVDKKDIRFVVHFDMPFTIEAYYQETGRAGRDGNPSNAYLIYCTEEPHFVYKDTNVQYGKQYCKIINEINAEKYKKMRELVDLASSQEIYRYLKTYFKETDLIENIEEKSKSALDQRFYNQGKILYCNGTNLVNIMKKREYTPGKEKTLSIDRKHGISHHFNCDVMLDYFDLLVLDCVYSLYFIGKENFFIQNIAQYLSGDKKIILKGTQTPNQKNIRYRIEQSLEKMSSAKLEIRMDHSNQTLKGNVLKMEAYGKSGYKFLEMPLLFQYAALINSQIYQVPLNMLYVKEQKKQSQNLETILLQNYLSRRIILSDTKRLSAKRRVLSKTIVWNRDEYKDLFFLLQIEKNARKIKIIKEKICVILEYYKANAYFSDYTITDETIEISYQ